MAKSQVFCGNAVEVLKSQDLAELDLSFLDPPFNQQKDYALHDDNMPEEDYWAMMCDVCKSIFDLTKDGGSIYFMQREKNAHWVIQTLLNAGWTFQNMLIWKKSTSAVPVKGRYGKSYQIIVYATKGQRPRRFNRLRIDPPLPSTYKHKRENGIYVTDVWDDIREMTSGYFAGDEAIRNDDGSRFHKQQAPIALLLRIILTSTEVGDTVLDPFSGTGTTAVVAQQVQRNSVSIELDPQNVTCIETRLASIRPADSVDRYYRSYLCTDNLSSIWGPRSSECSKAVESETEYADLDLVIPELAALV